MSRALIIARMCPGAEADVRRIFAKSDATDLPHELGVLRRSLYRFADIYIHSIEMESEPTQSIHSGRTLPAFRQITEDLKPFISPYDPANWRGPLDAMATEFYQWTASNT
jgi:hypothetical protein